MYILLLIMVSGLSFAQNLSVEPLYGFEKTYRIEPAPAKYVTRTYLGVRATYGTADLAGEFEATQSSDTDEFKSENKKVDYSIQRVMIGLKAYPIRTQYIGAFLRGGAQARQEKRIVTTNGVSEGEKSDIRYSPYAGAGLTVGVSNIFALNAGATLIYNADAPSGKRYDQQLTLGFTVKVGNR